MKKIFFVVVLFCLLITNLYTQSKKEDTLVVKMESFLVTGSRLGKDASKTSSNIILIDNPIEKNPGAKNLTYLLQSTEGIYSYDASGTGMTGTLNMRGFYGGMSSHHLILIDDIPQNKTMDKLIDFDLIDMNDIEKIEIIKGPASALYGDNAFSGIINVKTKQPGLRDTYKAMASFGSFNTQNYRLGASGRISNPLSYDVQVNRSTSDGFRDNSDYENNRVKTKINYSISKNQIADFSYDYTHIDRGCTPWALTEAQINNNFTQSRPGSDKDESNATQNRFNAGYKNELSSLFYIDSKINYRNRKEESFYTSGSAYTSTKERSEKEKSFDAALFGVLKTDLFSVNHFITIGCDFEKNNYDYLEWAAPIKVRGALSKDYKIERTKVGPYFQDEISIVQPLLLTIGMRYDLTKIDFKDNKVTTNSNNVSINKLSPKAGLVYSYYENSNIFLSYARAFRTPTIGQLFTYGSSSNASLNSEEGTNLELGVRHYLNRFIGISVSWFNMKVDNEIWYDYAEKKYKNYGKTNHAGVESKIDFVTNLGLTGFINYTFNSAKNDGGTNDGKYLPNVPEQKGSFGLGYTSDFGLSTNFIVTNVGEFYIDDPNAVKLDGFTTAKLNLQYKYKTVGIFLDVDNLFNERYFPYGYLSGATKYYNPAPDKRVYLFGIGIEI